MKKAVVLLSGGLDSATTLYYARSKGYKCHCLIFNYGQRHQREIESAKRIAQTANSKWQIVKIALPWKGSALLDKRLNLPKGNGLSLDFARDKRVMGNGGRIPYPVTPIPSTYVPARNIIFLSFALSYAEATGAGAIFIGANAIDYSGYPDCRPEFYRAFQRAIDTGTKVGVRGKGKGLRIEAPLIDKTKKEIVRLAVRLKAPLELTWSCYKGGATPCGACDSCRFREKGFREAGITDPLR